MIRAYITKDGTFNAAMTGSGQLFVNIGVFSNIEDEATLAALLAHEVAHYVKRHVLKSFVNKQLGLFEGFPGANKMGSKASIKMEIEADSMALMWIKNSGYEISGCLRNYSILDRLTKQRTKKSGYVNMKKLSTHPVSSDRLARVEKFIENLDNESGSAFLIGKEIFNQLKEEAKPEILKCLLEESQYQLCIEHGFKFHCHNPRDPAAIYYLMEGIRRKCYQNDIEWAQNFITNRYYKDLNSKHKEKKLGMEKDLFIEFDTILLGWSPLEIETNKANIYWDKPKFKTYDQAFSHFRKLGRAVRCTKCEFSNALSYNFHPPSRDSLMNYPAASYEVSPNSK
ncbi:MAG: M48 family metallopeptidase [Flavobacteriales bacterium]|nr:M48 family metallopeptidase [Flavobacteriales bacterium]